jgi:ABC-type enterobactin transport system permease subunit
VTLFEGIIVDWLVFHAFSDVTELKTISTITGMFITIEGILLGLSPLIKLRVLRDMAIGIGIPALLTAIATFSVATYNINQFGSLSANSITFYYWDPTWSLFLVLVEFYGIATILPFAPNVKEQLQQIKKTAD